MAITEELKRQAWQLFLANYTGPMAWCRIDFDKWWKNNRDPVCAREQNKSEPRCDKPCDYCLGRLK